MMNKTSDIYKNNRKIYNLTFSLICANIESLNFLSLNCFGTEVLILDHSEIQLLLFCNLLYIYI
jgi:hypothetical protein